jgi:hypothetical protein
LAKEVLGVSEALEEEVKTLAWYMVFAVLFTVAVAIVLDEQGKREAAEVQRDIARARYAEAVTSVQPVVDTVVREVTKTRTLRDSVLVRKTDTLLVEKLVYQVDTLILACERCAQQLLELRSSSEALVSALGNSNVALQKRLARQKLISRFGLYGGYGAQKDGTDVKVGFQVGVGVRLWP